MHFTVTQVGDSEHTTSFICNRQVVILLCQIFEAKIRLKKKLQCVARIDIISHRDLTQFQPHLNAISYLQLLFVCPDQNNTHHRHRNYIFLRFRRLKCSKEAACLCRAATLHYPAGIPSHLSKARRASQIKGGSAEEMLQLICPEISGFGETGF